MLRWHCTRWSGSSWLAGVKPNVQISVRRKTELHRKTKAFRLRLWGDQRGFLFVRVCRAWNQPALKTISRVSRDAQELQRSINSLVPKHLIPITMWMRAALKLNRGKPRTLLYSWNPSLRCLITFPAFIHQETLHGCEAVWCHRKHIWGGLSVFAGNKWNKKDFFYNGDMNVINI